ncbi:hypothetical protein ACFS7Z_21875 [Pontibacter toksunensis]|uniref:Uncharacterized protein n=1 Tax=Pontibacter toksunensis TaxID=1332631 RepID=A0ABW6BYZ8_9BACT
MKFLKNLLVLLVLVIGLTFTTHPAFSQETFYIKPWKGKHQIPTKNVVFVIDSLGNEESYRAFETIIEELSRHLKTSGIHCNTVRLEDFKTTEEESSSLMLFMSLAKPAYVYLGGKENDIPLCNRIIFKQVNFLAPKVKHNIATVISISIDKNDEAIKPLAEELSNKLSQHFAAVKN